MSTMTSARPQPAGGTATSVARRHWWSPLPPPTVPATITTKRAYLEVLVVFGVFFGAGIAAAGFALGSHTPDLRSFGWSEAVPVAIQQVATTILCVLVPVLLVRRRGLETGDLGLAAPGTVRPSQGIRMAAWAVLALVVGGAVTSALAGGGYPTGRSIAYLTANLFHAVQAGFIEEIVVLAFVVVTLEQARRPRAEIVAVAILLRVSYHLYYGWGAVGILVWAAVFLWLFFRFRTVIPLIVVHSSWDLLIFLANEWSGVGGLLGLGILGLFGTAGVLWLVDRTNRKAAPTVGALPGWYPDPGGSGQLRWFDGCVWTSYLHPPANPPWGQTPWGQTPWGRAPWAPSGPATPAPPPEGGVRVPS